MKRPAGLVAATVAEAAHKTHSKVIDWNEVLYAHGT